jgi:hypothetical protein
MSHVVPVLSHPLSVPSHPSQSPPLFSPASGIVLHSGDVFPAHPKGNSIYFTNTSIYIDILQKTSRRDAEAQRMAIYYLIARLHYAFSHVLYKKEAGKKYLVYESPVVLCGSVPLREVFGDRFLDISGF